MRVQKVLGAVLTAMLAKIGLPGMIDLSTSTGMSHLGLAAVLEGVKKNTLSPERAKRLLALVLAQWMCNIGRSDHQIQGYINALGGGDPPVQNKVNRPERFNPDEIIQVMKASIPA